MATQHLFEDADNGDKTQVEAGMTFVVLNTLVELNAEGELSFTHLIRPYVIGD